MATTTIIARNRALNGLGDTLHVALFTAAPDESGGGTELAADGYERQPAALAGAAGGARSAVQDAEFTPPVHDWTIAAVGLFDAASHGTLLAFAPLAALVQAGQTLRFAAGEMTVSAR